MGTWQTPQIGIRVPGVAEVFSCPLPRSGWRSPATIDFPGPLIGPQGAGGPGPGLGLFVEVVFGGPDDQGVGTAFDGRAGFGKVGGPGLETVGKGCCDWIMEEEELEVLEVSDCIEDIICPCELATTAAAAGNAWLITSAANSSGVDGLMFWLWASGISIMLLIALL